MDPIASSHPYPAHPLKFIFTRGSEYEIGRQHAEQAGEVVKRGMAKFYGDFWRRVLANQTPQSTIEKVLLSIGKYALDPWLVRRLLRAVPYEFKERIRGMAEGSSGNVDELMTALILPDLFPLLQAAAARFRPKIFVDVRTTPLFGCSSFVSSGAEFLVGRNLDFPGVAYWDRYQAIQLFERPGCLKYLGFLSAGVPIGGISGINEAQITVALHQHYAKAISFSGALPYVIGEEILGRAKNLDEALGILQKAKVATAWAFIVTDGKSKDGFIFESHAGASAVRRLRDEAVLAHSNYFQTSPCQKGEYATSARMNWDNYWRKTRLESLIKSQGASLSPQTAVRALSDHTDGYWEEEKIVNRIVSQVYNIQSLLLDPHNMRVWMATGNAPIHFGTYREYDLGEVFSGKTPSARTQYSGYAFQDERIKNGKQKYILSFIEAFEGDFEKALALVHESLEESFSPEVALVAGVISLKLRDFSSALDLFERGIARIEQMLKEKGKRNFPPEYFELCLYKARALDLQGKRAEAEVVYKAVASHSDLEDENIRGLARTARPYTEKRLSRIVMPYSTYIPFV